MLKVSEKLEDTIKNALQINLFKEDSSGIKGGLIRNFFREYISSEDLTNFRV